MKYDKQILSPNELNRKKKIFQLRLCRNYARSKDVVKVVFGERKSRKRREQYEQAKRPFYTVYPLRAVVSFQRSPKLKRHRKLSEDNQLPRQRVEMRIKVAIQCCCHPVSQSTKFLLQHLLHFQAPLSPAYSTYNKLRFQVTHLLQLVKCI